MIYNDELDTCAESDKKYVIYDVNGLLEIIYGANELQKYKIYGLIGFVELAYVRSNSIANINPVHLTCNIRLYQKIT